MLRAPFVREAPYVRKANEWTTSWIIHSERAARRYTAGQRASAARGGATERALASGAAREGLYWSWLSNCPHRAARARRKAKVDATALTLQIA